MATLAATVVAATVAAAVDGAGGSLPVYSSRKLVRNLSASASPSGATAAWRAAAFGAVGGGLGLAAACSLGAPLGWCRARPFSTAATTGSLGEAALCARDAAAFATGSAPFDKTRCGTGATAAAAVPEAVAFVTKVTARGRADSGAAFRGVGFACACGARCCCCRAALATGRGRSKACGGFTVVASEETLSPVCGAVGFAWELLTTSAVAPCD